MNGMSLKEITLEMLIKTLDMFIKFLGLFKEWLFLLDKRNLVGLDF
jgi:hypothetical protein